MNKFAFSLILIFGLFAMLAGFVWYAVTNESLVGAYILGIISTLLIGLLFWAMQLVNSWIQNSWEQKRFQDNAKENYTNILAQQKIQNEQTKGALMLADNARKFQPATEPDNYLVFDESMFDSLGDE